MTAIKQLQQPAWQQVRVFERRRHGVTQTFQGQSGEKRPLAQKDVCDYGLQQLKQPMILEYYEYGPCQG